jgi:nickel superoxide dismutase
MTGRLLAVLLGLATAVMLTQRAGAHCQIPCGIYDDPARFTLLEEHITTIEKSMNQITELSAGEPEGHVNQLVRWVMNKEDHADQFTEIVTFYFMAQRVKPAEPGDREAFGKYVRQVTLLHQMVFNAMKAKQTTDLQYIEKLRSLVSSFKELYMAK